MTEPLESPSAAPTAKARRLYDTMAAYVASIARVASWVVVIALTRRWLGDAALASLVLVRAVLLLMQYVQSATATVAVQQRETGTPSLKLSAMIASAVVLTIGLLILVARSALMPSGTGEFGLGLWMLVAIALRTLSEPAGAAIQLRRSVAQDNFILAIGELTWIAATVLLLLIDAWLWRVGAAMAIGQGIVLLLRVALAPRPEAKAPGSTALPVLLLAIVALFIANCTDYLYAPTDFLLIEHFLEPIEAAWYAPALQIDAALLLIVAGLSVVILPHTVRAIERGDFASVRRDYLVNTSYSVVALAIAAGFIWAIDAPLFSFWLGDPMPQTQAILPLVLLHTVIGGSAGIGRAVLLGLRDVRAYTISSLLGGLLNVGLSILFVTQFQLGLRGIVLGTVISVAIRCVLWMPWYILRRLRIAERDAATAA